MRIYIKKSDNWTTIISPAPVNTSEYHVVDISEEEYSKFSICTMYNPDTKKFYECKDRKNKKISSLRQREYEEKTDHLLKHYQSAVVLGEENAEDIKQQWIDEVNKIKQKFPFV